MSQREQERAPESQRGCTYIFSMPQHCFVAKRLNTALFCRETLKYGTFVAKKWIPCCKPEKIVHALCSEPSPHFIVVITDTSGYGRTDSLPLQKNNTTYICTDRKHGSSADSLVSILRRQYDTKTNPLTTDFTFPF